MLSTLEALRKYIENDSVVVALVSTYEGEPAVAFQTAPEDMMMPYVVTSVETNVVEDSDIFERMLYTVHVFVDNGDIVTADKISRRIEQLLHKERLPVDIGLGVWRDVGITPIPESDPGIVHLFQRFIVRHL